MPPCQFSFTTKNLHMEIINLIETATRTILPRTIQYNAKWQNNELFLIPDPWLLPTRQITVRNFCQKHRPHQNPFQRQTVTSKNHHGKRHMKNDRSLSRALMQQWAPEVILFYFNYILLWVNKKIGISRVKIRYIFLK